MPALTVLVAATGGRCSVELSALSVENLKSALTVSTNVSSADQILICGGTKLESHRSLAFYGLPSDADDKAVFLFDRKSLAGDMPLIPLGDADVNIPYENEPTLEAPAAARILASMSDPNLRALAEFEFKLRSILIKAKKAMQLTAGRSRRIQQLQEEHSVIERAFQAAVANLNVHFRHINTAYVNFKSSSEQQTRQHSEILLSFDADLDRLRDVSIHPALVNNEKRTLYDFTPVMRLQQWERDCSSCLAQLKQKLSELESQFKALQSGVENEGHLTSPIVELASIEESSRDATAAAQHQLNLVESLDKDYTAICQILEEQAAIVQGHGRDGEVEAVDLNRIASACDNHERMTMPAVELNARRVADTLNALNSSKVASQRGLLARMRIVSSLQTKIRDVGNKVSVFSEALQKQDSAIAELTHVQLMPEAYTAALAEVARRNMFLRFYEEEASQLAELLAKQREAEVARRDRFHRKYGRHLPKDFVPALFERPPYCQIHMQPFVSSLPPLDNCISIGTGTGIGGALRLHADSSCQEVFEMDDSVGTGQQLRERDDKSSWQSTAEYMVALAGAQSRCEVLQSQNERLRSELTTLLSASGKTSASVVSGLGSNAHSHSPQAIAPSAVKLLANGEKTREASINVVMDTPRAVVCVIACQTDIEWGQVTDRLVALEDSVRSWQAKYETAITPPSRQMCESQTDPMEVISQSVHAQKAELESVLAKLSADLKACEENLQKKTLSLQQCQQNCVHLEIKLGEAEKGCKAKLRAADKMANEDKEHMALQMKGVEKRAEEVREQMRGAWEEEKQRLMQTLGQEREQFAERARLWEEEKQRLGKESVDKMSVMEREMEQRWVEKMGVVEKEKEQLVAEVSATKQRWEECVQQLTALREGEQQMQTRLEQASTEYKKLHVAYMKSEDLRLANLQEYKQAQKQLRVIQEESQGTMARLLKAQEECQGARARLRRAEEERIVAEQRAIQIEDKMRRSEEDNREQLKSWLEFKDEVTRLQAEVIRLQAEEPFSPRCEVDWVKAFIYQREKDEYIMIGDPLAFLSDDVDSFVQSRPPYIVGKVVCVEPRVAMESGPNPYKLDPGTSYRVVTIMPLSSSEQVN